MVVDTLNDVTSEIEEDTSTSLVTPTVSMLSMEQLKQVLPEKLRKTISTELLDSINSTIADPDMYETYRDNLLSYTQVLREGKYKVLDYVNAVKYVSHKLMGNSNMDSYVKVFPDRYQRLITKGNSLKEISAHVTAYNKNLLVNKILEQTLIPNYILNQDLYQKALNVQADLMMTAKSEKVRSEAANSLLHHLKMPETQKVELDIAVKDDGAISALKQSTLELIAQQKLMLASGAMNAQEVASSKVVSSYEDVEMLEKGE